MKNWLLKFFRKLSSNKPVIQSPLQSSTDAPKIEAFLSKARQLFEKKQLDEALAIVHDALLLAPDSSKSYTLLGRIFNEQDKIDQAIEAFQTAIALAPDNHYLYENIGNCFFKQEKYIAALHMYEYANSIQPNNASVLTNIGAVLINTEATDKGINTLRRAIELDPQQLMAYHNMAAGLVNKAQAAEAIAILETARMIDNNNIKINLQLGLALSCAGELDAAIRQFEIVQQRATNQIDKNHAYWNCAIACLRKGDYIRGWRDYEYRWLLKIIKNSPYAQRYAASTKWQPGVSILGKILVVFCEQGFGDALQFVRYVTELAKLGAQVIIDCPQELVNLFTTVPGVSSVIKFDQLLPTFDLCISMLSLPWLMSTTLDTVPAVVPYLFPAQTARLKWQTTLAQEKKLKVGLVWSGSDGKISKDAGHILAFRRRNIGLFQCKPLNTIKGVQFYSLQKGAPAEELKEISNINFNIIDHTQELQDFADTAAFIENLDLVIGVDTAVIHLAGALNKPVWMLNRNSGCWRWLLHREDSPWYPSLKIFSQDTTNAWEPVLAQVTVALQKLAQTHELANTSKQTDSMVVIT